jgi:hypothetical protein
MEVVGQATYNDKEGVAIIVEDGETVLFLTAEGNTWLVRVPPTSGQLSPQEQVFQIMCEKVLDGDFVKKFLKEYGNGGQVTSVN